MMIMKTSNLTTENKLYNLDISQEILSDITVYMKYAKYEAERERREVWKELCDRNMQMHIDKFPKLTDDIVHIYKEYINTKLVLPSMRSLQFAGKPILINQSRQYNCSFLPVDDYRAFSEIMFLLLGGTGVGFSVQKNHIEQLPAISKPTKKRRYLVADSIEGWADAVKMLIKSYMSDYSLPKFDFSDVRPKGARLITSGGKAPGPGPLKECLFQIKAILDSITDGTKLTSLQVHDIICHIADAVLAGGIRRAALISLFDIDDEDMLTCKFGNWWELNPQRGRANNSAVAVRYKIKESDFIELWEKIKLSGAGEPGIYLTNNAQFGTNPCVEIALRPFQMCNLTEINMSTQMCQKQFNERCRAAAFLGTLQAAYTDFHYLRPIWQRTCERDALLGVSGTGIASNVYKSLSLEQGAQQVLDTNERIAKLIGINIASRTTCVKPAGTTSCVLGTSSGIHAWHDRYYIRRVRVGKNEAIYKYLNDNHSELIEDCVFKPHLEAVISLPQKAPANGTLRSEKALDLLARVKLFSEQWVQPGHRKGDNTHNVSATINLKDNEWDEVGDWMWKNKDCYNGLSVLPYDGGSYPQTPFESIDKQKYEEMMKHLHRIDLSQIKEVEDNTNLKEQAACAGPTGCEI